MKINVTKPYLPPIEEYQHYLKKIWESGWLTNYGPLALELEEKLKKHLGVKHLFLVNNGTVALQIAIKALAVQGDIVTTPFSHVATSASIVWEGCRPVYADIDPDTFCLNPDLIEQAITPQTKAILATHVYGYPCDVEAIQAVADRHGLKVIYDAAHAFGVRYKETSILNYGDVATLSFHATKLFHTTEGGALVTNDDELANKIAYMCNFGHDGPEKFWGLGINAKNSEFHAAMGLCILPKVSEIIKRRKELCTLYDRLLCHPSLKRPATPPATCYNYAYYPIVFPSEAIVLAVLEALNTCDIYPRRYFYPVLTKLNYVEGQRAAIAEDIASRILCLPLSFELEDNAVYKIAKIIKEQLAFCSVP